MTPTAELSFPIAAPPVTLCCVEALVRVAAQVSVVAFLVTMAVMLVAPLLIRSGKLGRRGERFLVTFVEYVGNRPIEG